MQRPEDRQHQRIIDGLRAGPDFLQTERPDHAGIARQMRFIVPNEAGVEHLGVHDENESKQKQRPKPFSLSKRSNHEWTLIHTNKE